MYGTYNDENYKETLVYIKKLKKLGFQFRGKRKFQLIGKPPKIEINTLEELLALSKELNKEIIITENDGKPNLEIYNEYRE